MNTHTYSQGYIYKLKTLHSRVDEVGKLMLSNKLYMYIGYPIIVYRCYILEFLHSNIIIGNVQRTLVKYLQKVLQWHHVGCNSDKILNVAVAMTPHQIVICAQNLDTQIWCRSPQQSCFYSVRHVVTPLMLKRSSNGRPGR